MKIMTTHSSATAREETPHEIETNRTTINKAVRRRANRGKSWRIPNILTEAQDAIRRGRHRNQHGLGGLCAFTWDL